MEDNKISTKNTKNELFEANQSLLQELENRSNKSIAQEKNLSNKIETVSKATKTTSQDIIHKISDLKIGINASLDELSKELVSQKEKLDTVQNAISIGSERLTYLYDIQENAETLELLILAQKQKKELFDVDMKSQKQELESEVSGTKLKWKKEKPEYEDAQKKQELSLRQRKKREEEEYQYQITIKKQKYADEYEAQKSSLERELNDKKTQTNLEIARRYEALKSQEDELKVGFNSAPYMSFEVEYDFQTQLF